LVGWLILSGCSGGGLQPVPVRGTVQYKGQALTNGLVAFVPVDPAQGAAARGLIRGDGRFKLTTFKKEDGAFPGDYNVTVFSYEVAEDPNFFWSYTVGDSRSLQSCHDFRIGADSSRKSNGRQAPTRRLKHVS
jgi:hypothetical protein